MELEEEWAEILGFPGYAVSNYGRIQNVRSGKGLRPKVDSYGYHSVSLRRDGLSYDRYVHQLVAKHFVTGYHEGISVTHHDLDRGNNYVVNLRMRGARLGRLVKDIKRPKFRRILVVETGKVFASVEACARFYGGDMSSIYKVLRGERLTHKGHRFEYLEEDH